MRASSSSIRSGSADTPPAARARGAAWRRDRARSPTSRAPVRGASTRQRRRALAAQTRRPPRRRPTHRRSTAPRRGRRCSSVRSRGLKSLGSIRRQPFAGVGEIVGRGAFALALEVRARRDQVRAVGPVGKSRASSAACDRRLELPLRCRTARARASGSLRSAAPAPRRAATTDADRRRRTQHFQRC